MQRPAPMLLQDADAGQISAVPRMRGRHDTREGKGLGALIGEPPAAPVKIRKGRSFEERPLVEIGEISAISSSSPSTA